MTKTKQQQRPKRKKPIKVGAHDKQKMKQILKQLASSKQNNSKVIQNLKSIQQFNCHKSKKSKKIQKQGKIDKKQQNEQSEQIQKQIQVQPIVNIFAVDNYISEKPIVAHNPKIQNYQRMQDQRDLQSRARLVMGQSFNLQRFGDKKMRVVKQTNQPIVMSDDQDQPNCLKTLTHQNIQVPQGNKKIERRKQIQQIRQKLPIYMKQQQIVQTINTHLVTLICGQTGSGKSTQLPQFLAQKNYQTFGKIAITQPRRLATVSLARRVADQMNCKVGQQVAYQVRHQIRQSQKSYIKFLTDGILLKQMSSDPLLLTYSVVVIDQAHERKMNTDILIGLLSKLILVRYKMSLQGKCKPLRLVIMSATMRVSDFENKKLFNFKVPILKVQSKMFPVTIFHQKKTPDNYIQCAVKKCLKIQKQLPVGDVLVFLTGKQQIHQMSIKLQMQLNRLTIDTKGSDDQQQMKQQQQQQKVQGQYIQQQPQRKGSNGQIIVKTPITNFVIYKLYSSLPTQQQDLVFKPCQPNTRKFILSTNIAQTSITVPNIRYVLDCGQEKHRYFDGVWKWNKGWGSRAMASQRAGRAGRTAHGYCYRLYSGALYANIMEQHPQPQICKQPLQSVVLQVKAIGFTNIFKFPFPTSPQNRNLKNALQNLIQVGAIQGQILLRQIPNPLLKNKNQQDMVDQQKQLPKTVNQVVQNCKVTQLGKIISFIPLAPKLSKMILLGRKLKLQKYILLIAVLLTIQNIFRVKYNKLPDYEDENLNNSQTKSILKQKAIQLRKSQLNQFRQKYNQYIDKDCGSDLFVTMNIVGDFLQKIYASHKTNKSRHAQQSIMSLIVSQSNKLQLNTNVMRQFYYNCDQIIQIYQTLSGQKIDLSIYQKPTKNQYSQILSVLLSTFCQNVCRIQQNNKYKNKLGQTVYVHRMSMLYKNQSIFIGCVQLFLNETNNRNYMRYPFRVQNYQLLSSFGKVKQPTQYQWKDGHVVGVTTGQIHGWQIPNLRIKDMKGQGKYFAFARMLLSGTAIPSFKILTQRKWLAYQISKIRPDNLQPYVQNLIKQLQIHNITSLQQLVKCINTYPGFLQKQLKLWLNVKNVQGVCQTLIKSIKNSTI